MNVFVGNTGLTSEKAAASNHYQDQCNPTFAVPSKELVF